MKDDSNAVIVGFIIGVLITIVLWIGVAHQVERDKVEAGFLTYKSKIYKVELYSELEYPPEPNEKD